MTRTPSYASEIAAAGPARLHCDTADRPCSLCIPDPHGKPACFQPDSGPFPIFAPLPASFPLPPAPHQGRA